VKGANLPMERVDASLHDWPLATWHSKQATDANYKRVLDAALRPEHVADVRLGVAGHNLFDLAYARHLATERGVADAVEIEMLLGLAPAQAEAVRRDVGALLLYTPVVAASDFDSAIAYLIRRLEEGASSENFMSAVFELASSEQLFARERDRFLASLADVDDAVPPPHRVQDRTQPPAPAESGLRNAPDTDPAVAANRGWARAALERSRTTRLGAATVAASTIPDAAGVDRVLATAVGAAVPWPSGARPSAPPSCTARASCSRSAAAPSWRSWPRRAARRSTSRTPRCPRSSTSRTTTPSGRSTSSSSTARSSCPPA